jgi:hypothetical protein
MTGFVNIQAGGKSGFGVLKEEFPQAKGGLK